MSDIQVEAYSGAHYAQRPRAFTLNGVRQVVSDILDQWQMPDSFGFRVLTESGQVYELIYRLASDTWEAHFLGENS